jgi:hypothetical protein
VSYSTLAIVGTPICPECDEEMCLEDDLINNQENIMKDFMKQAKLISYVKNEFGDRVGVIVALDKDLIGWAQCNPKDRFDKYFGIKIAVGRALHGTKQKPIKHKQYSWDYDKDIVIDMITPAVEKMRERAKKYFK